jgi:NTE family protein
MKDITTLVCSGSGIKFLTFIGAYQRLFEEGLRFKKFIGTSGGALFSAFAAANCEPKDLLHIAIEMNFKELIPKRKLWWLDFFWSPAIYSTWRLEKFLRKKLRELNIEKMSDFQNDVLFLATNITKNRILEISNKNFPHLPIAKALIFSMNVPFLFRARWLRGSRIYDGGILANTPINFLEPNEKAIIMKIRGKQNCEPARNTIGITRNIIETMMYALENYEKVKRKNIYYLEISVSYPSFYFGISKDEKKELFNIGYKHASEFLRHYNEVSR